MMKRKLLLILISLSAAQWAFGQKVAGYIYDADSHDQPMTGVSVYYSGKNGRQGTVSDARGYYEINVPDGGIMLTYSFLGYETQNIPLVVNRRETLSQDVYMKTAANQLDAVVVSAGRFDQKLSDITVSMNVLKSTDVLKQNPSDLRATLNTIPGVDVVDKQPTIRGGSGWTYGVGSRTLILVDGMSILSPNGGEINWNSIPMENIEQVEVIKGASSVLYGSSALNGLINIRTSRPGLDPVTRVNAYTGIYGNPSNKNYIWWDRTFWKQGKYEVDPLMRKTLFSGVRNPMYNGLDLSHARRIGNWDVSGSMNLFTDEGYKQGGYNKRIRVGGNVTHHDPNVEGLHYGLNVNFMSNEAADVFLWRSPEQAYMQSPLTNMAREGNDLYIDPFITYYNARNRTSHKIRSRMYFTSDNMISRTTDKSIVNILNTMGFDYDKSIPEIMNNGGTIIASMLPTIFSGNTDEIIGMAGRLGNHFFPDAKPADYMDLLSWFMGRSPMLPSGQDDILNWILKADGKSPEPFKYPDRTAQYYLDYQFNKSFDRGAQITAGATYEHLYTNSEITGKHWSDNAALYFQYDDKFFDRLNILLGIRFEYYRVDNNLREADTKIFGTTIPVKPVARAGINYQLGRASFIRASIGQGYRYPSITEKFVRRDIGGIGAFPNPDLKAETGYNVELGFRQGYKFGPFSGYMDIAGFYTQYKDMIEFNIGLFNTNPPYQQVTNLREAASMILQGNIPGIGAQFSNVDKARIYGVDFSINGIVDISPATSLTYSLGYVYTEPEDVNYKKRNAIEDGYADPLQMKQKSNNSKYLKYRQKHSVKAVFDFQWKRLSLGTNLTWKSKTLAVDYFMADERAKARPDIMDYVRYMLFGDLHNYWQSMNKGYFVWDVRAGVQVTNAVRFQFSVNNVLNKEYSIRPMDVSAPRTFVLQAGLKF